MITLGRHAHACLFFAGHAEAMAFHDRVQAVCEPVRALVTRNYRHLPAPPGPLPSAAGAWRNKTRQARVHQAVQAYDGYGTELCSFWTDGQGLLPADAEAQLAVVRAHRRAAGRVLARARRLRDRIA